MRLGSFVTGLAAVVVVMAGVVATPAEAVADQLGTVWNAREGDYDCVWTRRGSGNVFDGACRQRYTGAKVMFGQWRDGTAPAHATAPAGGAEPHRAVGAQR